MQPQPKKGRSLYETSFVLTSMSKCSSTQTAKYLSALGVLLPTATDKMTLFDYLTMQNYHKKSNLQVQLSGYISPTMLRQMVPILP